MYRFTTKMYMDLGATLVNSGWTVVWTDVTADVITRDPIVVTEGRRHASPTDVVPEPGTLTFTLNNGSTNSAGLPGYYSPYHTACRDGFGLRTPVRFGSDSPQFPYGIDGISFYLLTGRIIDIVVEPGRNGTRATRVTVGDLFFNLAETPVQGLTVQTNKRADELLLEILNNSDDPDYGTLYSIYYETGSQTFATAFDSIENNRTTILEELNRIALSERGRVYGNVTGLALTNQYGVELQDPSGAVHATLDESMVDMALRSTSDDLVQRVDVTCHPTTFGASNTTVLYSLGTSSILVQPGEVNTYLFGPFRDTTMGNNDSSQVGGTDFQSVTATTDYTMNAAADGSGTNLTANFTVTASTTSRGVAWTITNTGTTAGYITKLQLRGRPIYRTDTTVSASTGTVYGTRIISVDMPYQTNLEVASRVASNQASFYSRPGQTRAASVRFEASKNDTLASAAMAVLQSHRIALTETQTGLSKTEYLVIGRKWEVYPRGLMFCTWYLEALSMNSWITPSYSGGTYTSSSGSWTVASGDVVSHSYILNNRTMTLIWTLDNTSVSGTPTNLQITIPEARLANMYVKVPCIVSDNGTYREAIAQVNAASATLIIYRRDGGTWTASTDLTSVAGEITFETTT